MGDRVTVQWEYKLVSHRFSFRVPQMLHLYLFLLCSFLFDVWGGILRAKSGRNGSR